MHLKRGSGAGKWLLLPRLAGSTFPNARREPVGDGRVGQREKSESRNTQAAPSARLAGSADGRLYRLQSPQRRDIGQIDTMVRHAE